MHLLIAACAEAYAVFAEAPCVVGGGEARLVAKFREDPKTALPKVVARAQQLADAREDVVAKWSPREDVAKMMSHEAIPLRDIMPGEPTLRVVQCGKRSLLPCDAPLVEHTWQIGKLSLGLVQRRGDSVRFGVKIR
jgi:Ser-tRNA(Ala) deacylase AlaX